jgi:acetyltransferase-like isoleucine patch superfamily enzyme
MERDQLHQFWLDSQQEMIRKWNRLVPLGDCVGDRWERARLAGFGEGTSVYDSCLILGDVHVGKNTWIGPFTILDGSGGLTVGDYCSISAGVQIYTHDSIAWCLTSGSSEIQRKPTRIGNNCYIGPNAIIAMGVTVGDRSIVGANSLVLSDIPEGSKAVGTPCRVIGTSQAHLE